MSDLRLERLGADHDLSTSRSGQETLDGWLRSHALSAQRMDSARTFVLIQEDDVVGYFSLTMASVLRSDAPRQRVRGLPGYPVGVALLARLTVDAGRQGEGLGALLAEALRKAVGAGDAAPAPLVVVDTVDDAAARFYPHHGFLAVPEHPMRLYRRIMDIRASPSQDTESGGEACAWSIGRGQYDSTPRSGTCLRLHSSSFTGRPRPWRPSGGRVTKHNSENLACEQE